MPEAEPNPFQQMARTVGQVVGIESGRVSITTPVGQKQQIVTTSETIVVNAEIGDHNDVHAGDRVIVKTRAPGQLEAVELVVLPATSSHGLPVVAVAPDSVTYKALSGDMITVGTTSARIDKTTIGSIRDIGTGATVFALVQLTDGGTLAADELIVLPNDTAFGTSVDR
jgi:hypothetical protein